MFIRNLKDCPEFTAGDATRLREPFNPRGGWRTKRY